MRPMPSAEHIAETVNRYISLIAKGSADDLVDLYADDATVEDPVGGAFYSIGGVLYALRWPDPWPSTFGYHEFFHACTAIAAICHYIAMWFVVF